MWLQVVTSSQPISKLENLAGRTSFSITLPPVIAKYGHKAQTAANTPNVTGTLPGVSLQSFKPIRVTGDPGDPEYNQRIPSCTTYTLDSV